METIDKQMERGSYVFQSNTELHLTGNATVLGSEKIEDYYADEKAIFEDTCGNELGRALFFAYECENIALIGEEGCLIDGRGYLWVGDRKRKRPSLIRIVNCKNVVIRNLKLVNSACWCVHLQNCENVLLENLWIASNCNSNNDGIDIDCCRNVRVKNCRIESGDDAIVLKSTKNVLSENVVIEDCIITTEGSAFKLGTESVGDFKNIRFERNTVLKSCGCAVKIVPVDGSNVDGIFIKDIVAEQTTGPVFIANGYRQRVYFKGNEKQTHSTIKNVVIENFTADVYIRDDELGSISRGVVFASGTPENRIQGLVLKNCKFIMPCGETDEQKVYNVTEMTTQYPEYYTLGTAPAYGGYFRRVDGLTVENVQIQKKAEDVREEWVFVDSNKVDK